MPPTYESTMLFAPRKQFFLNIFHICLVQA